MSGAGFFLGTTSPASTVKSLARTAPTACSSTARTDGSAEVDATASVHPAACASSTIRAMPGRAGSSPSATIAVYRAVLCRCQEAIASAWAAGSAGRPVRAMNAGVSRLAIRSLPPPMDSRRPYSSSSHRTGRSKSANVRLNAGRWPKRSVSASTPSQSKISAVMLPYPRCRSAR
jgi:hypothetical protein